MPQSSPPPQPPVFSLASLFRLRPAGRRWPFAARAAICMGVPVLAGWLSGNLAAGLVSTLGAFTVLYGSDRPFINRASYLAVIALCFALAVMLGVWAAETPILVVPVIVIIAMTSTFLCNALRTGPPGAYMFALSCAAGTSIPTGHLSILQVGLLVFAGGAFAWLAHMVGMFFHPQGPERAAVITAANTTASFAKAINTPDEDKVRHHAALALHQAWAALVSHQPSRLRPGSAVRRLRALNRQLHLLFANLLNISGPGDASIKHIASEAIDIADKAKSKKEKDEPAQPDVIPLGHHSPLETIRDNLKLSSPPLLAAIRVGIATAIAGALGMKLGLERAYWVMASAVLILHQGLNWKRSLQRGVERMVGTLIGLLLAGGVLAIYPQGLWLVITLMILQFSIEMLVVRNYALAVVFITAAALTIGTGGEPTANIGHLLWVRASDTLIGCVVGLVILAVSSLFIAETRISRELVSTLATIKKVLSFAARGDVTSVDARRLRRDLQHRSITLLQTYDTCIDSTPKRRDMAEHSWPTVIATQRLAYRVLALCWSLEAKADDTDRAQTARTLFGPQGEQEIGQALLDLSNAIRSGTRAAPLAHLPDFISIEMQNLRDSLVAVDNMSDSSHDQGRRRD